MQLYMYLGFSLVLFDKNGHSLDMTTSLLEEILKQRQHVSTMAIHHLVLVLGLGVHQRNINGVIVTDQNQQKHKMIHQNECNPL